MLNKIGSRIIVSLLFLIIIFQNSCKTSNPVNANPDKFVFKVIVKDSKGNPVPGIRVSAWNLMRDPNGFVFGKRNSGESVLKAATMITTAVEENSNVNINLFDLDNNFVDTIVDSFLQKGVYNWQWTVNDIAPIKFFKCKLIAMDSLFTTVLFSDSVYMILYQPDRDFTYIGWTNSNGIYETEDQRLFPSSMDNFIPMVYCDESSPDTSHFQFIDSVRIVLTDTNTNVQNIFTSYLNKKENIFEYTWNGSAKKINICERKTNNQANDFKKSSSLTDYHWKLYQNYPNPFN